MSPLYELECLSCGKKWDELLKDKKDLPDTGCPACASTQTQVCMSGFGGYSIKGNNSASVRPKGAGSRK